MLCYEVVIKAMSLKRFGFKPSEHVIVRESSQATEQCGRRNGVNIHT